MSNQSSGKTTLPAESTQSPLSARGLALRWVFPDYARGPVALDRKLLTIGRAPECDVALPGTEISRQHAEIRKDGPIFIVRDLGSRNGSFVRGTRAQESPLEAGDVLRFGEWLAVVVPQGEAALEPVFSRVAGRLLGGPQLRAALELGLRAAKSDLPILIEGETGTGKELTARALHERSGRAGPFVGVNCAALPEALAEAELFGYRRGAFTGADRAAAGFFRAAQGGTLLLDELTDLPLVLQAKLLRVIEERQVVPLGEAAPVPLDVRFMAATQKPLVDAVAEHRFRPDLLARLDGVTLRLPPLRERREDIAFLLQELLKEHAGGRPPALEARVVETLMTYDWPLNVRELDLLVRRLLVLFGHEPVLRRSHLLQSVGRALASKSSPEMPADKEEDEFSRLVDELRRQRGNVAKAAAQVGISRQRAYRLMENRGGFDLQSFREQAPLKEEGVD